MYLLFECGTCGSLYQLQAEKITVTLQKAVCNTCKSSYFFGPADQSPRASEPMIERIMSEVRPAASTKPASVSKLPAYQVLWKCGVCESIYQFNLNRVTEDGIKITCITCFQFFILQKTISFMDVDFLFLEDEKSSAAKNIDTVYPTKNEWNNSVYEVEVSEEVLSKIPEPKSPESKPSVVHPPKLTPVTKIDIPTAIKQPAVRTEEILAEPAEPKSVSTKPSVEGPTTVKTGPRIEIPFDIKQPLSQTEEFLSKIPEPIRTPKSVSPAQSVVGDPKKQNIITDKKIKTEVPASEFKKQTTQPEAPVLGSEEPTITKKIILPPQSSPESNPRAQKRPPVAIQANDLNLVNSFKSFNAQKAEFKIAKIHEATSITFVDHFPTRKKTFFEKYMIKVSIWAIGISIIGLGTVFIYDWYRAKQEKNVIERTPVVPMETSQDKPKYGFPELGE